MYKKCRRVFFILVWCSFCLACGLAVAVDWGLHGPGERVQKSDADRQSKEAEIDPQKIEADRQRKEAELRQKYPLVSLESRLPKGNALPLGKPFSQAVAGRWDKLEQDIETSSVWGSDVLRDLHEKTRKLFVESPGFGSGRMRGFPEEILLHASDPILPADQPGIGAGFPVSEGEPSIRLAADEDHYRIHLDIALGFLNPWTFGYVKDRKNVAGFRSHGFQAHGLSRAKEDPWKIENILLVGLLMDDVPRVYLSDKLPSMELTRVGKVRELDLFEEAGLKTLQNGEDLYIIQKEDALRMFGALRATKQCLKCHDAERGDLLGAFSYTLRRVDAPE